MKLPAHTIQLRTGPVLKYRLRVALQEQACLLETDMLEYMPACKGVRRLAGQAHRLRLAFSATTGLCLCVYLAVPQRGQFTVLQLVASDNRYSLDHISSLFTTQVNYSCCSSLFLISTSRLSTI